MKPLEPHDPRQVGRYRILAVLGEGGMGRALLAVGPDGRFAAVKLVSPALAHDPVFRARFRREVEASRRVSGAYTAAVLDADTESETPWLASLYVPGPSLADVLDAAGPLDVAALRHLAVTLAVALADIHRAGLVHRDLKPGNVLLTHDGPRIIDFGIARAADGSDLTATNALIGSPAFMSPEQALGGEITPASDVFSLGSLLLTAATGQRPFAGTSTPQTLYNVAHTEPDLSLLAPEVGEFVGPCLAKNPAERPTPAQLVEKLGPVSSATAPWPTAVHALIARQQQRLRTVTATPPPPPPPSIVDGRRRSGYAVPLAALASAVVAVLVVVVVNLTSAGEAPPTGPPAPSVSAEESLASERLRRVDPCAVLAKTRVPSMGLLLPEEDPIYLDRCRYEGTESGSITLTLGETFGSGPTEPGAEGRPVQLTHNTGGCEAAVQLTDAPALAVRVGDSSSASCATPKAALDEALQRLRGDDVLRDLPSHSALGLEVCLLLNDEQVRDVLGPARSAADGLHGCEWSGTTSVRVRVVPGIPGAPPDENSSPLSVDGIDANATTDSDAYCAIRWTQRQISDSLSEEIEVYYLQDGGDDPCGPAQRLASDVAANLPRG
ncbi:serine/threonine-protein kinase [Saccharomonospora xinjiangensis]|uniref:serine/threonine-protein kinase n=1 Tax=Saccharomonospora xinjiangensis TaxID=75294 RepID=UPI00350EE109